MNKNTQPADSISSDPLAPASIYSAFSIQVKAGPVGYNQRSAAETLRLTHTVRNGDTFAHFLMFPQRANRARHQCFQVK